MKENKEFNPKQKVKTELKLHVMYEGWKKDDKRHPLINKQYIAGIMKPKEIKELRDARVYQQYDEEKIKLRATNGDGAPWTRGTTVKGGIYQKDQFHIMQEIVRDVPKEYREEIKELIVKGASTIVIRKKAIEENYRPLVVDGIKKVLAGDTTLEEVNKKLLI